MSSDSVSYREAVRPWLRSPRSSSALAPRLRARPELIGLAAIAGALNLWGLSINGWANTFYSAAVRSMAGSWHDFLFASLDQRGLMTVDKPPLSLWVQALSARVFGAHPLSLLIPQALMGVAATGLIYDLTRRRFGRPAGFVAGLALATTPVVVAVSRHNNPDELLALCCVAAVWLLLRALDTGRTRWLVLSGVCVGLGFETKMGVALTVVPGIAAAYLWVAPRGRIAAVRQLLAGGLTMAIVGLAWPLLVTLTPAADRPWISGTADNSIWSLIFSYNGIGRITGQSGGPAALGVGGGGGGGPFGGSNGVFRLLGSSLGDQAGWLLGFSLAAGVAVLGASRLRREDPRTGWLIAVGGAFLTTGVLFSIAQGIFHPYYLSLLAPFAAALIGAGLGQALSGGRSGRIVGPLVLASGGVTELAVLATLSGQLSWAKPLVTAAAGVGALALALRLSPQLRMALLALALGALFAAPACWAAETLGHPASATFPAGGSASASAGGLGGARGFGGQRLGLPFGPGLSVGGRGFGGGPSPTGRAGPGGFGGAGSGGPGGLARRGGPGGLARRGGPGGVAGGGPGGVAGGGPFGGDSPALRAAIRYAAAHGGGTIGVSSQSTAAAAILSSRANVAGLGGFSGRESSVTPAWIAMEVRSGHLRWVIADAGPSLRRPGDTRQGSQAAMNVVAKTCQAVRLRTSTGARATMYDCQGRASMILAAAGRS